MKKSTTKTNRKKVSDIEDVTFFTLCEMKIQYNIDRPKVKEMPQLTQSWEVVKYLRNVWEDNMDYKEEFLILLLNRSGVIIGWVKISSGGQAGTIADPKIIFQHALLGHASSIILSHNHP